jgi:hypothetical protein
MISRYNTGSPDHLQQPLPEQIDPTAVIALQGAGRNADQRTGSGQRQGKQQRHPRAKDHPRQHIPRLIIGAQPVLGARRARCRIGQVVIHGIETERDRRKPHPPPCSSISCRTCALR